MLETIDMLLHNRDVLYMFGIVSLIISVGLLIEIASHFKFYFHVAVDPKINEDARDHVTRLVALLFGIFLSTASVMLYGVNWALFDGGYFWRTVLKVIQIFSLLALWGALRYLRAYYRKG